MPGLEARDKAFFIDGKKITLLSGAVHYFRVVPEYWKDRLLKVKAAGLNCVETYVAWNAHERIKGEFDFTGMLDVRKFIQTAQEVGLYVLFRPGPYICSEWDFGGLPSWLLHDPDMKVRTSYQPYLDACDKFYANLLPQITDLQHDQGGPIIAVQIENEYGSYGDDLKYKTFLKDSLVKYGVTELLFTSDNGMGIQVGNVPGVLITANFQEQEHGYIMFEYLKNVKQPNMPLMVMEYWAGWFDHWGKEQKHNVVDINKFEKVLRWLLGEGSSVNFYMYHGGTNFGFMAGANEDLGATNQGGGEPYAADVTSYDYDCPISESGQLAEKFYKIREVLRDMAPKFPPGTLPDTYPEPPAPIPSTSYGELKMQSFLAFKDILQQIEPIKSKEPLPMEMLDINNGGGQGYGFTLYRKSVSRGKSLKVTGQVRDRATVFVNGTEVDTFDSRTPNHVTNLTLTSDKTQLDIMVENMGRVNYADFGSGMMDSQKKGLQQPVELDGKTLEDWEIFPLEWQPKFVQSLVQCDKWQTGAPPGDQPVLHQATLTLEGAPQDTFIRLQGWTKGLVFINGFNLGRYWNVGPQETLYVPGPLLKQGDNQVLIFELHKASPECSVTFQAEPRLGEPLLHSTVIPEFKLPE